MENDAPRLGPNHGRDVRKDRTGCAEVGPRERSPRPGQEEVKAEPGTAALRGRSRWFVVQCPPSGSPPAWEVRFMNESSADEPSRHGAPRDLAGHEVPVEDSPVPAGPATVP